MKRLILCVWIILALMIKSYSQEYYQQSKIEFGESLDSNRTYVCKANNYIKLLSGFQYSPTSNNNMSLDIDRYSIFSPEEGYYKEGEYVSEEDMGAVVGTLPATFDIGNTGSAIYSIDINLPAAIGAMMPKLSVVYNSQSGNGLMGWSWDIGGLSAISRVGQTEYHDGKITDVDFNNDRFALDGQRLLALDGAKYGANGTVYKTEIDNMDKVVSYTNGCKTPQYFVVWKSDGMIWEYGSTDDSKIEPNNIDGAVFKWLLNRISDRDGNAVLFHYDINNVTGESYISDIEYTVNEKNGVDAAYKVVFKYDMNRVDAWGGYVSGIPVTCARLLKNIQVLKNDTGKILFDYSFEYHEPAYYNNRYFLHYRLKSIGLAVGDKKINPTRIVWNNEKKHYPQSKGFEKYELNKSVFADVSFVGDFNGDGLSDVLTVPYKIQDTYPNSVEAKVFINNGDGTFEDEAMLSLSLPNNLDWIYVVDMNDDGVDDIISYEYNYDYESKDDVLVTLNVFLLQDKTFVRKASYYYKDNISLISGNFISNDKSGVIVFTHGDVGNKSKSASYITYSKGNIVKKAVANIASLTELDADYMAMDMTGDGVSEFVGMAETVCYINKLTHNAYNDTYSLKPYLKTGKLNKEMYLFPNDFNGDGKTDVLCYDQRRQWNILISKGNDFAAPVSCTNTNLLRNITLNSKDRYRFSLRKMMEPTVAIRTADFDGDGISDVGVFRNTGGNYYLQVGFLPYLKNEKTYDFSFINRYYAQINYSHQTIHIGRFLPQENTTFISSLSRNPYYQEKPYIISLSPHSAMYSVERIIDGLGNSRGFCYDFLLNKKGSDFYTSDNDIIGNNMRKTGIPLSALKSDTVFSVNGKPIVTAYNYRNGILHTKGHGFMGFKKITKRTIVDDECVQKQVIESECKTMGEYSMLLPSSMKIFQSDDHLVKEVISIYEKWKCNANAKVMMPLLVNTYEIEYDYDKQGEILRKNIVKYDYQSDNTGNSYDKLIQQAKVNVGYTDDMSVNNVEDCAYKEETITEFDNDLDTWIINRPVLKKCVISGKDERKIGNVETFVYECDNPLKITTAIKVPNVDNDQSDSLMISVSYEYDKFGHMIQQKLSSPSLKYDKILEYEYGENYQYRYLTKTIDELGNAITCDYDNDYGMMTKTVDYNQFVTENVKDPLGIDDKLQLSDGMQRQKSLRWAIGNEYAPKDASYYCWDKSTGKSETMIFYHKNGSELRTVTFDINGDAVFRDIAYDDFGNVVKETLPYYVDNEKIFTTKKYDKYNRLVEIKYPNDLICEIEYEGNKVITSVGSKDGNKRIKIDNLNEMGWVVSTTDVGGNVISYEYYSDGLVKSALINGNENTRIIVEYDNNRNRSYMRDPNYGSVSYFNDALGNITKVITNNGNISEFEYDKSGRKVRCEEIDSKSNEKMVTSWIYDDNEGKKGTLKKVHNENHSIEYFYDDKLRLITTKEIIDNVEYNTSYTYDEANRISSITYPTGFTMIKAYSSSGYEQANYDKENETLLWRTIKTNACGDVTEYQFGNGVKTKNVYNPKTSSVDNIRATNGDKVIQDLMYEYDEFGNVLGRSDNANNSLKEVFEYDVYDRLKKIYLNDQLTGEVSYDNMGNIIYKDVGDVRVLYDMVYDDKMPYSLYKAKTDDAELFIPHELDYSALDNVRTVVSDNKKVDIKYGCEQKRISMNIDDGNIEISKVYVGNNEFVAIDGDNTRLTYLMGPIGVYGVCALDENGNKMITYIHKDNIDTWSVITDENANILQRLSFDAWGNMRDPDDWHSEPISQNMMYDRGYTGHEHLCDFGLINMNGRMYDPIMSVMISPDNNIQMPQLSQNFNRYSYCLNNPLKYNDPTGEWVESVLLGVVLGASNVVLNAEDIDTFSEGLLLFGAGFVQGFLAEYTIGQSWCIQVCTNTLTGGLKSGVNEMVSVGDGSFNFSGDDWNAVAKASYYGLGSSLVKGVFNSYVNNPTEDYAGDKLQYLFFGNEEVGHAMTSLMAHGAGCWFSGQPMLSTMRFKDVGFDMRMLSIIATRLMRSYIYKSDFSDRVVEQRAQDIKDKMMSDILSEDPDHGDFEMRTELSYVDISAGRLYVSGNIFAMLPGEMFKEYPKPYLDEVVSFPFTYSLFKTLFFNK